MSFLKSYFRSKTSSPLNVVVDTLAVANASSEISSPAVAKIALSGESHSEQDGMILARTAESITTVLDSIIAKLSVSEESFTEAHKASAMVAGIVSADPISFLKKPTMVTSVSGEGMALASGVVATDGTASRAYSSEAYDARDNRTANIYSIAYNLMAARQDEFGETFFPTITISPDEVGFGVTIRLMTVFNDFKRNVSGALDQYNKINIIRSLSDHTVLKNDITRIIPVYRTQSAGNFVANTDVAPYQYNLEGEMIETAPLAVGKQFSLLGISQTDTMLASGIMDVSDSIEPAISLQTLYVKFTDGTNTDVISFDVSELPYANFTYATQGNFRLMNLNFTTSSILINKNTKRVDGSPLTVGYLAGLVTNNQIARLTMNASGSVNIELANTVVYGNSVGLSTLQNADGTSVDTTTGAGLAFLNGVQAGQIIGYDLYGFRSNLNRRQRGQLFDVTYFTQLYNIPMRAPITAVRPINNDGATDSTDLGALITVTRIRTSNEAVTTLVKAANTLANYVDARDSSNNWPAMLGISRYLVRPTYNYMALDLSQAVDSISSSDRIADTQATLVNRIRDFAYRMYRDSEYMAAAIAMSGGGVPPRPTVIIGTDPVIARYLTITGDLRELGNDFDARVVSTLDSRVTGRIFVTFGAFGSDVNTVANPLHFGNMGWKPELTMTVPITRNGAINKELVVQPSFLHVVNLPVLIVIDVLNLPNVLVKVPLYNHPV